MFKRLSLVFVPVIIATALLAPATVARSPIDIVENFATIVPVRDGEDFPVASLMRADCAFVLRIEHRNGSAREVAYCKLSDAPVNTPAFQGATPKRTFLLSGDECMWWSDYWFNKFGTDVAADSFQLVVTPGGHVVATSTYPATPLTCE